MWFQAKVGAAAVVDNQPKYFVLTFVLCGVIAGIVLAVITIYIVRRQVVSKEKLAQLASTGDGTEASKDYQVGGTAAAAAVTAIFMTAFIMFITNKSYCMSCIWAGSSLDQLPARAPQHVLATTAMSMHINLWQLMSRDLAIAIPLCYCPSLQMDWLYSTSKNYLLLCYLHHVFMLL